MLALQFGNKKRIRKDVARKLYNQGLVISLLPCNMTPGYWVTFSNIWNDKTDPRDFDAYVNEYEYYNCGYNETGYYASYYITTAGN